MLLEKCYALNDVFPVNRADAYGTHFYYCFIRDNKQFRKLQNWVKKQWKSGRYFVVTTVVENTFIVCYKKINIYCY